MGREACEVCEVLSMYFVCVFVGVVYFMGWLCDRKLHGNEKEKKKEHRINE